MSFQAISWAFSQRLESSSAKFILICLANFANDRFRAYPSVKTLEDLTGMDRKTIIVGLDRLTEWRLISDTGDRVGTTKQVKVYQLNTSLEGEITGRKHYVYRICNPETSEFYYGVHSSYNPENDHYYGSGRWPSMNGNTKKEVVSVLKTRLEAENLEGKLIRENISNPLCRNRAIPPNGSKNGTVDNSSVFPLEGSQKRDTKGSQKRDTDPIREPVREPVRGVKPSKKFIREIQIQIEEAEQERTRLKNSHALVTATGTQWDSEPDRQAFIDLGRKVKTWRKEMFDQ